MSKFSITKNPTDVLEELASKCRALRKKRGFSQLELSKRSGVSLGSLKRFERTGKISLESLLLISNIFNCLEDFDAIFKQDDHLEKIEKLFSDKTRRK